MAKGNINPEFQAAPFYGESSFDANQFMDKYNTTMYQQKAVRQEKNRRDTAAGLASLELDLKGLYDQQGIDEILGDQERIKKTALEIQRKGVPIFNPTEPVSIKANLAITKALEETKKKVDVLRTNKEDTDLIFKMAQADAKLPEDQRIYDWDATSKNLQKIKESKSGVLETAGQLKNALVLNPTMGNVDKVVDANKEYITKVAVDPVTMKPDPAMLKQQKEDMKKLFRSGKLGEAEMRALKRDKQRMAELNPGQDIDIMPLEDYFVDTYTSKDYLKKSKVTKATQDPDSGKMNIGGTKGVTITPGIHHTNPIEYGGRTYNDRYDFATDKVINVNSKGGEQFTTIPVPIKDSNGKITGYKKTGWEPFEVSGNIEATLLHYDPKTKMLIFKNSATANLPWAENNAIFTIPVENVPEAGELNIKLDDGKMGKLKDILPKEDIGVNSVLKKKRLY